MSLIVSQIICHIFHFLCSLSPCSDAKDNSFTRSRSSSVTSIDRESREAISSFHFCESFSRKTDPQVSPCLLVGTTQGSVMIVALSLPPSGDPRLQQPVGISSCGKNQNIDVPLDRQRKKADSCVGGNESIPLFLYLGTLVGLKGGILTMALLDAAGALLPSSYEPWYDPNTSDEEKEKSRRRRPASPPSSQEGQDCQFAVLCSDKQAKVVAMPSQTRVHKHNITEASFVLRADVVQLAGTNCITCFCANGHIMTLRYHLLWAFGFFFSQMKTLLPTFMLLVL